MQLTLLRQGSPLSRSVNQVTLLEDEAIHLKKFGAALRAEGRESLNAEKIELLQINVGKLCNQTCSHCHVDAGPGRREIISRQTLEACLHLLERTTIATVDITGGAPEMVPDFRWFVSAVRELGRQVIDRCNLTILIAPGFQDLPEFLADHQVEVVASLPCYLEENTDKQRGQGVFAKSIEALQRLNSLGYGQPGTGLPLTLVYNPLGPSLPPAQKELEAAYRRELTARYEITFSRLYTVTNMPISRFLEQLLQTGQYEEYMLKLIDAFNPETIDGLMCRNILSVDWQGDLYDCDFNQMLGLHVQKGIPTNVSELDDGAIARMANRQIVTGRHCFGCTAGAGSSCHGSLTK